MTDDDVTLGEVARRLTDLSHTVTTGFAQIRQDAVLRVEYEARLQGIDREIRDIKAAAESSKTNVVAWIAVAVAAVAAVLGPVLSAVLSR